MRYEQGCTRFQSGVAGLGLWEAGMMCTPRSERVDRSEWFTEDI